MQPKQTTDVDRNLVSEMLGQYIETALWSSNDESDDRGGAPLDANYGADDISAQTRWEMERDCVNFLAFVEATDKDAYAEVASQPSQAGHDFWLTRNGHGAGFWDGDWEHGDMLTTACKTFGSVDLYVGDDGKIYA